MGSGGGSPPAVQPLPPVEPVLPPPAMQASPSSRRGSTGATARPTPSAGGMAGTIRTSGTGVLAAPTTTNTSLLGL